MASLNRLNFLALLMLATVPGATLAQSELETPFVRDIWSGRSSAKLLPGMADPRILREQFLGEARDDKWAADAESKIESVLSTLKIGKIDQKQIQCRATRCQVIFTILRSSLGARKNANDVATNEITQTLTAMEALLDKEMSVAMSNDYSNPKTEVLVDIF